MNPYEAPQATAKPEIEPRPQPLSRAAVFIFLSLVLGVVIGLAIGFSQFFTAKEHERKHAELQNQAQQLLKSRSSNSPGPASP